MVIKLQSYVRWKSETAPEGERGAGAQGGQGQQVVIVCTISYIHTLILFDSCRSQLFGRAEPIELAGGQWSCCLFLPVSAKNSSNGERAR